MCCARLLLVYSVISLVSNTASALTSLDIQGAGLELDCNTTLTKIYNYKFNGTSKSLNLTCTFKKPQASRAEKFDVSFYNERICVQKETVTIDKTHPEASIKYSFTITPESRQIFCVAQRTVESNSGIVKIWNNTINLKYIGLTIPPETITTALPVQPGGHNDATAKPVAGGQSLIRDYWKLIAIAGALLITLCVVVVGAMKACQRKKPQGQQPPEPNYVNLTNTPNRYQTTPVAAPRKIPTVESNYSEPKDSNDMQDALYAELNNIKPETTYAEPYKMELYATPIPKAVRKPKQKDESNYSNMFGDDYVNSDRK